MKADKLTFGWERLSILLKEPNIRDLLTSYWQELSPLKGHRLDIDWQRLLRHEAEGIYRIWTVRVNGTLAGFAAFYVQTHMYHKGVLAAVDGGHYLAPAFRDKGRIGWRMWKTAKAALLDEGVQFIMLHDNARRPLMPFFLALGFEPLSTMWIWTPDGETADSDQ
jgi:hypothetical protein